MIRSLGPGFDGAAMGPRKVRYGSDDLVNAGRILSTGYAGVDIEGRKHEECAHGANCAGACKTCPGGLEMQSFMCFFFFHVGFYLPVCKHV